MFRKLPSNPREDNAESGRTRLLSLAATSESALCQQIWKLLTVLKDNDIFAAVCTDFYTLQLARSFLINMDRIPPNSSPFDRCSWKLEGSADAAMLIFNTNP